jgi:hypothetical protein
MDVLGSSFATVTSQLGERGEQGRLYEIATTTMSVLSKNLHHRSHLIPCFKPIIGKASTLGHASTTGARHTVARSPAG